MTDLVAGFLAGFLGPVLFFGRAARLGEYADIPGASPLYVIGRVAGYCAFFAFAMWALNRILARDAVH